MRIFDIVKDNNKATFSHFCGGNLYYTLEYDGNTYMFYINTDPKEVGVATFSNEMKAITLMRWIRKCMEKDEFIKIS